MRTLIRGGTIVTETETYQGDVLIEDGKILEIRKDSGARTAEAD